MGFTSRPQAAVGQLLGVSLGIGPQGPHHRTQTWGGGRNWVWVLFSSPFCSLLTPPPPAAMEAKLVMTTEAPLGT